MVETQPITYLRNHLYLPHLDPLLYFTPDKHNYDLVRQHLTPPPPNLESHQIPPLPNHLLHQTSHLLPQPPQKTLPDLLLQLTHLGLHNHPHHYLVPPPAIPRLGGGGVVVVVVASVAFGIEGFMASSVGCRVICRVFRVSSCLFLIFVLNPHQKHKNRTGKRHTFFL